MENNIPKANTIQTGNRNLIGIDGYSSPTPSPIAIPAIDPNSQPGIINTKPNKYNIIDLYWLFRLTTEKSDEREADVCIISFNIDFGNLRIVLYDKPAAATHNNTVFLNLLKQRAVGTIYPTSCYELLNIPFNGPTVSCIEQLIESTGEAWQMERPIVYLNKYQDCITMSILNPKNEDITFYHFVGWQEKIIYDVCNFATTEGFSLRAQLQMRK